MVFQISSHIPKTNDRCDMDTNESLGSKWAAGSTPTRAQAERNLTGSISDLVQSQEVQFCSGIPQIMQTFYGIIPIMNKTLHEYDKDLKPSKMKDPRLNDLIKLFFNPISYGGASEAPP